MSEKMVTVALTRKELQTILGALSVFRDKMTEMGKPTNREWRDCAIDLSNTINGFIVAFDHIAQGQAQR